MNLRWAGRESLEAIADVRLRSYSYTPAIRESFIKRTADDRFADGDVALLEDNGVVVGTATHLSLQICTRGGRVPCQGVAWVGTVRSHRRRRVDGKGIASTVMNSLLDRARERGDAASALMPFRSSFYEHFGYGTVERQAIWTVPIAVLPAGETGGFRDATPADYPSMAACRARQAIAGNCDVDGGPAAIPFWMSEFSKMGFTFVDQPTPGGPITGFVTLQELIEGEHAIASIDEPAYDSPEAFGRILGFLANLKDQYTFARMNLPVDLPLNWLLKERQVPHRRIDHPAARCNLINRMQLRVLDHRRFIEPMRLSPGQSGKIVVAVEESEGAQSRFSIEFSIDRAEVRPSQASADVTVKDSVWAAIVTGNLRATDAKAHALIDCTSDRPVALLDRYSAGPAGFCWEYF